MCLVPTTEGSTELPSLLRAVHALVPDGVELLTSGLTELLHVLLLEFVQTTDLLTQLLEIVQEGRGDNGEQ